MPAPPQPTQGPRCPRRFHGPPGTPEPLSSLDTSVLALHAQGYTSAEIAAALHYSHRHIQNVSWRILRKLEARNMTEAVVTAMRQGLISRLLRRPDR